MTFLIVFALLFIHAWGENLYRLVVEPKQDVKTTIQALEKYGLNKCKQEGRKIICVESSDLNYVQRLKDFISQYGFTAKVELAEAKTPQTVQIQRQNTENAEPNKRTQIDQSSGPQRKTSKQQRFGRESEEVAKSSVSRQTNLGIRVKLMYDLLNEERLKEAQDIAKELLSTPYRKEAEYVLGLIALKEERFSEACRIFSSLKFKNSKNLEKDSCSTAYMKEGYEVLDKDPSRAVNLFLRSLRYKDSLEARLGLFYAYMRTDTDKAQRIIEELKENYPDNEKVKEAYAQFLLAKGDLEKLSGLEKYISETQLRTLQISKQISKEKKEALDHIRARRYDEAERLLIRLYTEIPSDIDVILLLGYLYFEMGDYLKAKNYYENALLINGNNTEALRGLKGVYVKLGYYEKALEMAEMLRKKGIREQDYEKIYALYLNQKAREHIEEGRFETAKELAEEALKYNKENSDAYLILADYYKQTGNKREYFRNISKAYELNREDFGTGVAYAYALLDMNFYDQARNIITRLANKKLSEDEKEELKDLYKAFYQKFSSYYLSNKDYIKASRVASEGLSFFERDPDLMEVLGWSCYNLKDYNCSKEVFEYLVATKPTEGSKLGLAYTYLRLSRKAEVEKLLRDLETSTNPDVLKDVATIYYSIGKYREAKRAIEKYQSLRGTGRSPTETETIVLPQREERREQGIQQHETLLPEIFNSEKEKKDRFRQPDLEKPSTEKLFLEKEEAQINFAVSEEKTQRVENDEIEQLKREIARREQEYLPYISMGIKFRNKSGESGKTKLIDLSPFVEYNHYFNENFYAYLGTYLTNLSSGRLTDYANYGSFWNGVVLREVPSSQSGLEPFGGLGIKTKNLSISADFSITPFVNNNVPSAFMFSLEGKLIRDIDKFGLGLYRAPIRDSMLSYVGSIDPYSLSSWGRVYEEGTKFSYERQLDEKESLLYAEVRLGKLKGKNTQDNTSYSVIFSPKKYYGELLGDEDYIGLFSMYSGYRRMQGCFFFGCGGYFSPKNLLILAPMLEGFKFFEEKNGIHYKLFVGPLFWYDGRENNTELAFDGYIGYSHMFSKNITLNIGAEYRRTQEYSEIFLSGFINYYFSERNSLIKKDLRDVERRIQK